MAVGSQSGEYIHIYERVHIGAPNGWGSRNAPSYGLSTYGGAWFATDTGVVNIGNTSNTTYKFYVNGHSYFNGNTTHNGIDYFANGTTYFIDNSAQANLNHITIGNGTSGLNTLYKLYVKGNQGITAVTNRTMTLDTANINKIGTTTGDLHIQPVSVGSGSAITNGNVSSITFGCNNVAYAGIYSPTSGSYGNHLIFATTESYANGAYGRMIITASGNVGIGTMSPSYKLHVLGDIYANGGWLRTSDAAGWYNETYGGGWYMTDSNFIRNYNSKAVSININSNNAWGIGSHRLAAVFKGNDHVSILLSTNTLGYGLCINNDGNWYWGKRTTNSETSTSGDTYLLQGNTTLVRPSTNMAIGLGQVKSSEFSSAYIRAVNARHLDASGVYSSDMDLYIGYGNNTPTQKTLFYYSTGTHGAAATSRTQFAEINSNGLYALTRFGVNGQNTSYNFYVNGTSYFNGNTTHNGIDYFANGTTYYINNSAQASLNNVSIGGVNFGYKLYVNGTSYFNGNVTHNGIDYFANGTTYYINNSADAKLRYLALGGLDPTSSYQLYVNGTSWIKGTLYVRHLYPEVNNSYDLGSTSYYWRNLYVYAIKGASPDSLFDGTTKYYQQEAFRTLRDFTNGTLITTDLNGGTTNSSIPFYVEIVGNGYGNGLIAAYCQGYVYNLGNGYDEYINCDAYSIGKSFTNTIYAFSDSNGKLCFWFARMAYWQGFDIKVYDTSENINTKRLINHVVNVTNVALPTARTWETQIAVRQTSFTGSGTTDNRYVLKSGDTMTGHLNSNSEFITTSFNGFRISAASSTSTKSMLLRNDGSNFYILCCNSAAAGNNWYTPTGGAHPFRIDLTTGYSYFSRAYGAVWNDYAEYRITNKVKPGQCVIETGLGDLVQSTKRLQPGANIVSDTFGFAIGETEQTKTPLAVSGRVLAYPYEDRYSYSAGDPVCSGPNGTISKMTRKEVREYPDRIVGTVSEIPEYETWGTGNVKVNGRIWIKVK